MKDLKWFKLDKGAISDIYKQLDKDITLARLHCDDEDIKFYVGTDSQRKKKWITYVTAIVLYKENQGGSVYYVKQKEKVIDMRTRLWNETYMAVNMALALNTFLKDYGLRVAEVHADLNADVRYKSNALVKSCLGYICGMGFDGYIKPDAWCASKIANKMTK